MADRYWVGGSANWDGTAGTKWATASGGAGGASVPTTSDNVFFDAASGAVTVTVTTGNTGCADLTFTGFTGTFAGSAALTISGSLTLAAGMTRTYTGLLTFDATTSGKTITSAGKTLGSNLIFNGVGGVWTLQDAFDTSPSITLTNGTFDTNGHACTAASLGHTSGTATLTLGASTLTLDGGGTAINWSGTGLTLNAGTSTIAAVACNAVQLTSGDSYTFNNLSISGSASAGAVVNLNGNQTVGGTLTLSGNSSSNRLLVQSTTAGGAANPGVARTITAAAVSITDVDFADITGAGAASPFTGTRLGDCKGNSGITFTAAADKYWVGNTANWNSTSWALSSGGAAGANNFPLPQDTCIFDANSFSANGQTITMTAAHRWGTVDFTAITETGITLAINTSQTSFGNLVLDPGMSVTGGQTITIAGRTTQTLTSAGCDTNFAFTVDSPGGTFQLADPMTFNTSSRTFTLTNGTFDMNGQAASVGIFSSSNSNTRAITSGGATLTLTGNGATIWNVATATGLTLNDALQIDCTYSGAASVRTISHGSTGGTEANAPSVKISAGSDQVTTSRHLKNIDYTGFTGTETASLKTIYGDFTLSAGMTYSAGALSMTFAATSGTKTITTNGKTMDFPVTFNGVGGTWQLADNMTVGSTRTTTLTNGTLDINGKDLSTGLFSTSNSNARTIKSTAAGGKIATTDTTATTVFTAAIVTNLTVTRNSWTIEIGGNTTNVRTANLGAGITWPTLSFTNTTASGGLDIVSSGTSTVIKSLAVTNPPQTIRRTAATTITVEDTNGFPSGTLGNLITIGSITAATHTWTKSGAGLVDCDYLSISRSTATPASTWYAGSTSTDGGNNTGWLFSNAPVFMTAEFGSFTLTGQDATFIFSLPVTQGDFSLVPQEVLFDGLFSLVAESGSFALNGQVISNSLISAPIGTGSFNLEFQQVTEDGDVVPLIWSDNSANTGTRFSINSLGTQLSLKVNDTNYSSDSFPSIVGDGKFHHIAVTRDGTTLYFWLDGQSIGTATDSTNTTSSNAVRIGSKLSGNLDDLRVTKAARYVESFTPAREHPDQ